MRKFGNTRMEIKRVGFGGIPIQRISQEDTNKVIDELEKCGVNFIDTARGYTISEEYLGNALKGRREKFYIATKSMSRDYESMKKDIEISLKNLQTDYIDLYQMHNVKPAEYDTIFGEDRAYRALLEAKEAGKIKHIGITSHGLETVEKGVGTIVMKPLAGGAIDDGTLAMKYILSREYIDVAIPGMDTPEQVKENTAVLENFELTEEDNVKITKIKSELGTNFCRRCEYCLPCPQGVIIPQNFLLEGYYTRYGLQDWAIDRYKALGEDQRASNCVECGACESKCPYELPIIEMLKNVVNTLEK